MTPPRRSRRRSEPELLGDEYDSDKFFEGVRTLSKSPDRVMRSSLFITIQDDETPGEYPEVHAVYQQHEPPNSVINPIPGRCQVPFREAPGPEGTDLTWVESARGPLLVTQIERDALRCREKILIHENRTVRMPTL